MRHRTLFLLLISLWFCIVLFCTKLVPSDWHETNPFEIRLSHLQWKLQTLQQENEELRTLVAEFRHNSSSEPWLRNNAEQLPQKNPNISSNEHTQGKEDSSNQLTYEAEHARRKTENTVTELWYFIESQFNKSGTEDGPKLSELKDSLGGYKSTMFDDLEKLRKANKADEYREQSLQELGDLVQRRLEFLQNPDDCDNAKKIICRLNDPCGFTCQLHHVTLCLITAYAMERTLVLNSDGWQYAGQGWETVFEPVSKSCDGKKVNGSSIMWGEPLESFSKYNTIDLPYTSFFSLSYGFLPLAVPADLAQQLSILHGNPSVWWIGQIVRYLLRLNPDVLQEVTRRGENAGFTNTIVGVHVRRTDKVGVEADFHSVEEYMYHVKEYYDQLERTHPGITRRVYLASDEPAVLTEARQLYPTYQFISDFNSSKAAALTSRYSEISLLGVISDLYYLSRCDYLVCTFSSGICRVAYELMQTVHGDASRSFRSLDDMYFFPGQFDHDLTAVESHQSNKEGYIDLQPGDVIGIAGNHWNGFSKGKNRRTNRLGLFPSYKAEDTVVAADMPTYPNVPLKLTDKIAARIRNSETTDD